MKFRIILYGLLGVLLASCIKEEGVDREADIVEFSLPKGIISNISMADRNLITVTVHDMLAVYDKRLTPVITVSPGATITPASGEEVKVNATNIMYTVKSQDGKEKPYLINFVPSVAPTYDFEEWIVNNNNKNKPYDTPADSYWSSANPGIRTMIANNTPFPTGKTEDSHTGKYAALLETKLGNIAPGSIMHTPIFAGSLFRGIFKLDLGNPVRSAKFGQIHTKDLGKPMLFSGYYKYKPGPVFTDEVPNEVPGKVDKCDIYAVLFKVTQGKDGLKEYLTAEDLTTSTKVVAKAFLTDQSAKDQYTRFQIPFVYTEELDYSVNDYKLAIVLSSSAEGAFFRGAVGSLLHVDDLDILCDAIPDDSAK